LCAKSIVIFTSGSASFNILNGVRRNLAGRKIILGMLPEHIAVHERERVHVRCTSEGMMIAGREGVVAWSSRSESGLVRRNLKNQPAVMNGAIIQHWLRSTVWSRWPAMGQVLVK